MRFFRKLNLSEKWFIFILCLFFHLWKIGGDLPNVYDPDEPHHLNVAAAYSTGDLNPHDFKYPALWSYLLSTLLGCLFLISKWAGLTSSSQEFALQYLTEPTVFYMAARILSATLLSLSIPVLYASSLRHRGKLFARIVSIFFLLTPIVQFYGRDGTLYGLLIFLIAFSLSELQSLYFESDAGPYLKSGIGIGLAMGTHYLAAPLLLLIPALHLAKKGGRPPWRFVAYGLLAAGGSFLMTNPFILIDFKSFYATMHSLHAIQDVAQKQFHILTQLKHGIQFLDPLGTGILLTILGFVLSTKEHRREIAAWLSPFIVCLPYFAWSYYGWLERYSLPVHMPILITAALGAHETLRRFENYKSARIFILLLIFLPSLGRTAANGFPRSLPDTRTLTKDWIETNIPSGSRILIFDPFKTPQLKMSKVQIDRLYEKAKKIHHPRELYFHVLRQSNPCRVYEIFSIPRTDRELQELPERTRMSYLAQDVIDPETVGLDGLRQAGIDYLIIDPFLLLERGSSPWLQNLTASSKLVFHTAPKDNETKGPELLICQLSK